MSECQYKQICPTTNYWLEDNKEYINDICNTKLHTECVQFKTCESLNIKKDSKEWKRMISYFEERKRLYPPHGIMNIKE